MVKLLSLLCMVIPISPSTKRDGIVSIMAMPTPNLFHLFPSPSLGNGMGAWPFPSPSRRRASSRFPKEGNQGGGHGNGHTQAAGSAGTAMTRLSRRSTSTCHDHFTALY